MAVVVKHSTIVSVPDDGLSPVGTDEWNAGHTVTGLENVDNTSDVNKPVSTAQTAAIAASTATVTKTSIGLGNVDNTSDVNKPVSTAQTAAIAASTATVTKTSIGLGNVDNTSDVNKPVSTAQSTADALVASNAATAIALKASIASPTFTGTPAGPTAALQTNTTQLATTAFALLQSSIKVTSFTRVMSTASGNQAITGIGFKPRFIQFQSGISGGSVWCSIGSADATLTGVSLEFTTTGQFIQAIPAIQREDAAGTKYNSMAMVSMDTDGFTVAWTKVGLPTLTATINCTCYA